MAASMSSIPVPSMDRILQHPLHVECVKLLATALTSVEYGVTWTTDSDGTLAAPSGIRVAVTQVYGKLRQHPLIGKYVIPESLVDNPDWLGSRGDRILSCENQSPVTSKKIHWEVAVMAASVFLCQKYLEVIADMHLWNMGADSNSSDSGLRPVAPSYQPGVSQKSPGFSAQSTYSPRTSSPYSNRPVGGWDTRYESEEDITTQDDDIPERTYYIQNRSDYRLLNPRAIRVLVHGNYRINEKGEPGRTDGMTVGVNAFDGLANLNDMAVSLFGMQYRSITVQACQEAIPVSDPDSKTDQLPPSYDATSGIDVCPQLGFLVFHKEINQGLVFAETGGVTFVRQPHLTGQSTSVEEPLVPSSNFFNGSGLVSAQDAMLLWASTPLPIISAFGLIRKRVLQHAFVKDITRGRTAEDLFEAQLQTAQRINHRGVDPHSLANISSATIVRFGYNEPLTEVTVRHFVLNQMKEDYVKNQGNGTELYMYHLSHARQEAVRQRKMQEYRNHKSYDERCGECCCTVWCGKDWCESGDDCFGIPDCPESGICGCLCTKLCLKWPFIIIGACICRCCCCCK